MIRNTRGAYVALQPVDALGFPWAPAQLPNSFASPAWGDLQDPITNGSSSHSMSITFRCATCRCMCCMLCIVRQHS